MSIRLVATALLLLASMTAPLSQSVSPVASHPSSGSNAQDCSNPSHARKEVEYCKYMLERDKLDEQRRSSKATFAALLISALVGFGTIAFNSWNAAKQARFQAKLKALEVVVSAAGPNSARQRLDIVDGILGKGLVTGAKDPSFLIEGIGVGHDQGRRELLKSLADYPERRREILADWRVVFGNSKLGPHIRALQARKVSREVTQDPATPPAAASTSAKASSD